MLKLETVLKFCCLCAGLGLTTGCKSEVFGEYISKGTASLQLFEEKSGTLFDIKNGRIELEVQTESLNPLADTLVLRLRSSEQSFLLRIDKTKIGSDGSFVLSESELEQPIRISGRIGGANGPVNLLSLVQDQKSLKVDIEIFKGFSSAPEPIGTFSTRIESQILKDSEVLNKQLAVTK